MVAYRSMLKLGSLAIILAFFFLSPTGLAEGIRGPLKSISSVDAEIASGLDLGNPEVEQTAVTIAKDYPGEYNLNQVSKVYDALRKGWYYNSDPSYKDKYKNANRTLKDGKNSGTIGVGDCDDFAILMASLLESLQGSTRIIFAYDRDTGKNHAYAEVYLGKKNDPRLNKLIVWFETEYNQTEIPGQTVTDDELWINLDYNNTYPGGYYFGSGHKVERKIVWQSDSRNSPKVVPIIDTMDSIAGWNTIEDEKGSNISISSASSPKKGKAIQMNFKLKEGGQVGISRNVSGLLLSQIRGLNLTYYGPDIQTNILLELIYKDGTIFGYIWTIDEGNKWISLEALFEDFTIVEPMTSSVSASMKLDPSKVQKLEIVCSSRNGFSDSGYIILDNIRGVMNIPMGSPWARVEEQMIKISGQVATGGFAWTPMNFPGFFYDINENTGTEMLATDVTDDNRLNNGNGITYVTTAQNKAFKVKDWGTWNVIGFLGEQYFAGYNSPGFLYNLSEDWNSLLENQLEMVLIDDDTPMNITSDNTIKLKEGYELAIKDADTDGTEYDMVLFKNGDKISSQIMDPALTNATDQDKTYFYRKSIVGEQHNLIIIAIHFKNAYRDVNGSVAIVDYIWQISESPVVVKEDSRFDKMTVETISIDTITMSNKDNDILLGRDKDIVLMRNIRLRTADSNELRYYIYKEVPQVCKCYS